MKIFNLGDCKKCPKCKSDTTYLYHTDHFELNEYNNIGYSEMEYHC